jgi:hypothetical protein
MVSEMKFYREMDVNTFFEQGYFFYGLFSVSLLDLLEYLIRVDVMIG